MKKIRICILVLICAACTTIPVSLSAGTKLDSLYAQSDVMVSGHVVRQHIDLLPDAEGKYHCTIDFVIFMMCAESARYAELLKITLPGDTLSSIEYVTTSRSDTTARLRWLMLPLKRDTTRDCGWRLTNHEYRSGIFGDTAVGGCNSLVNYIYNEHGVVEQRCTFKGSWGYTTFTSLDGTVREQWKSKWHGEKSLQVCTEYFPDGRKKYKVRKKATLDRHGVRAIAWTFRDNGKLKLHRQKMLIWD